MSTATVVLARTHESHPERRAFEDALGAALAAAGCKVVVVPHLYYLTPSHPAVARLLRLEGDIIAAGWLHARALRWTLSALGLSNDVISDCHDLRTFQSVAACRHEIVPGVHRDTGTDSRAAEPPEEIAAPVSQRWYPVLDYSRCAACKQCFGFCLFGVYSVEHGRVVATQPDNCKNGCPACARVCPEGAIIFPHCDDPAIAGSPGAAISRNPDARPAVLQRVRRKQAQAAQARSGDGDDDRTDDDLESLLDALESLDD